MPRGKGGGPKTPEGKARSSQNALKNGSRIRPGRPNPYVIEGLEDPAEWEAFRLGIIESWQPDGAHEEELATNIAHGHWKLRRCQLYENRILSKSVASTRVDLYEEVASSLGYDFIPGDDEPVDHYASLPVPAKAPSADETASPDTPSPDARSDGFVEFPDIEPERLVRHQELRVIPNSWEVNHILRYEAFVRKALAQDIRELETQQARRNGIRQPTARVVFSSDPSPAKVQMSANDIPEFQFAQQRVRMAENQLAEKKFAARQQRATK